MILFLLKFLLQLIIGLEVEESARHNEYNEVFVVKIIVCYTYIRLEITKSVF